MSIRILLADDPNLMRQGISMLIAEQPGMTVVAEARDGETAVFQAWPNALSQRCLSMEALE